MQSIRMKIGTFNLFNLISPGVNFYERPGLTQEEYTKKISWVAEQIKEMDCDIIAFQEVFHKSALQDAIQLSGSYRISVPIVFNNESEELKPNVGLISKFPILEHRFIVDFPDSALMSYDGKEIKIREFHRPIIRAVVELPNGSDLIVYAVHFKSNLPIMGEKDDRTDLCKIAVGKAKASIMRSAEAAALRCLIIDDLKKTKNPLVVLGDFNDTIHGSVNRILLGEFPRGIIRHQEKANLYRLLLHNCYFLTASRTFRDVFYTSIHAGMHEAIDHILVSDEFLEENPDRIGYVESLYVLNDHIAKLPRGPKSSIFLQSDHGQVVVTIKLLVQRPKSNRPDEDYSKFY